MKNPELYNKTIGILVKAYLNNTLKHRSCTACAVGNIINHYMPFTKEVIRKLTNHEEGWSAVFSTLQSCEQVIIMKNYYGLAKEQIESTGYSLLELAKIENKFELAEGDTEEQKMYNGLMSVFKVLGEIHEVSEEITNEKISLLIK